MNFDGIAGYYHWLEQLFAGDLMQRNRTAFLQRTRHCRRALLVGEGTGRFLAELLRHNPQIEITCVEQSAGMIREIRQRLMKEHVDGARVEFRQMDALAWMPSDTKYDLIATNFFLDCFQPGELQTLVERLAASANHQAIWLVADFCVPENGWRRGRARILLAGLYGFFRLATSLSASRLTPPDTFISKSGFKLAERRFTNWGFVHADLWTRNGDNLLAGN